MKDNRSFALNNIQKGNAPPQRRGSYGSSEFGAGLDAQPGFDPSMSSREMRKIMYYENMFSKMDSQDKTKKSQSGSQSFEQSNTPLNYGPEDMDISSRSYQPKNAKNGSASRKSSSSRPMSDRSERVESRTGKPQMDDDMMHKPSVVKQNSITVKMQNHSSNGSSLEGEQLFKYRTGNFRELNNVVAANRKAKLYSESISGSSEANTSKRSSTNSLPSVTEIAGSKISKLLGIDQTASSASELSASQRQWLVPMFQILQPKPVKDEPVVASGATRQANDQSVQHESAGDKTTNIDTHLQVKQELTGSRSKRDHRVSTLFNNTADVEPKKESQQVDECSTLQDHGMDVDSESKHLHIIVNEEDMEIDPILKDEEVDDDAVIKEEEDEEYVPEIPLPIEHEVVEKKPQKRKSRQRKGTQRVAQTETEANSDFVPSPETMTPESMLVDENYPEPLPVSRPTKTRTSARTTGRQRKKDPNFIHESDIDLPVPAKTPRSSVRSTGRGTQNSTRKHAQEHAPSKSQTATHSPSMYTDTQENMQKRMPAVSRIISVSEAEKIVDLYRQHSTDLERLKKLILMGDLSEFGNIVAEQTEGKTPQHSCILDPRMIAMQPDRTPVKVNQEPPPQNPVELSLKYRLVSKLMGESKRL